MIGSGYFNGVNASLSVTNIAVINGSVRGWGGEAVALQFATNCRVADLIASGNTFYGIIVGGAGTVVNCSAYQNGGAGIFYSVACTITNCTAYNNPGDGIGGGGSSTITGCVAYTNTGAGIRTGVGSIVTDCTASANTQDGIVCQESCLIRANTCLYNGSLAGNGAGIRATGIHNRIEGNNCTGADRGIAVDAAGNIIIKNTCSGNTNNWDVVAGNIILVVNATPAAAVTGNSGGTAPGSTDPNANFSY